jgi:enamine deaminase RidA (YjgF/YER057c/UK114 family)
MGMIDDRLGDLGITLPEPPAPVASYVPFVITGNLVHVSARICGLNLIAQLKAACNGDLDRLVRVVKLGGFVNVTPDFAPIPAVMNGCSDLMLDVFGDAGRHARSAVGVANLPFGFAVEVDGIFEISL